MNPPKGVDLKFTSFAKKPAFQGLGLGKGFGKKKKQPKYRPGGDWADDPVDAKDINFGDSNSEVPKLNGEIDFMEEIEPPKPVDRKVSDNSPKKSSKGSKFGFIKKKKKESSIKAKFGLKKKKKDGLLSLQDLKQEKYGYPKKMVQEIVEPIGARKKPSDAVMQKFVRQTSNFNPTIVLSVLYHLLEDPEVEWLSKYRSLLALERLIIKNPDYAEAAKKFGNKFQPMLENVCQDYEFEQKSHERLINKAKAAVLKLFEGSTNETDSNGNKGFDFNKMSEMVKNVGKKNKNPGFLSKMNKVKKESKKKTQNNEPQNLNDEFDLLDLNVTSQNNPVAESSGNGDLLDLGGFSEGNLIQNNSKPTNNQSNTGFDLDLLGGGNGFQQNNKADNQNQNVMNSEGRDLFDLDFGMGGGNQMGLNKKPEAQSNAPKQPKKETHTPNYDDLDFL